MTLRQTALRTYLECPLRYRFEYVDQIPRRATGPLAFGRAMHRVLERLHRERIRRWPVAQALFRDLWAQVQQEDQPRFRDPDQVAEYAALGPDLLRRYLGSPPARREPLVREYRFALAVEGHTLTGTVDRLDEDPRGLVIGDYKTGRRRPSPAQLDADLQFTVYGWGVSATLDLPVVRCEYLYLRRMEALVTHRGSADYRRLREEILPGVFRNLAAQVFPPRPYYGCRYCDYASLCPTPQGPER